MAIPKTILRNISNARIGDSGAMTSENGMLPLHIMYEIPAHKIAIPNKEIAARWRGVLVRRITWR